MFCSLCSANRTEQGFVGSTFYVKTPSTSAKIHNPSLRQPQPTSSIRQCVLIPVFTSICLFHRLLSLKIAVIKKTEFTKKMETQTSSPSKRSTMKPAVRQARPNQHHSCPRRRTTGDPSSWSVALGGALCCCFSAARTQFVTCFISFVFLFLPSQHFLCVFVFHDNKVPDDSFDFVWLCYYFVFISFLFS